MAFKNCDNLRSIVSWAVSAPSVESNSFLNIPTNATVHVPCGSQSSYAAQWTQFSTFTELTAYTFGALSSDVLSGQVQVLQMPTCQDPTARVCAIASEGYTFHHWSDGSVNNPRTLTLTSDSAIVAYFSSSPDTVFVHDTIWQTEYIHDTVVIHDILDSTAYLHDTIYLYDTIYHTEYVHDTIVVHDTVCDDTENIKRIDVLNVKVYSSRGQVVVEGADGMEVTLYDAWGRVVATRRDGYDTLYMDVPASGTYIIKIGHHPSHKIVVIR